MGEYLDFENEKWQKGFKPFKLTKESVIENKGKMVCYVDFVEPHRGTYIVRYGRLFEIKRNNLLLDGGHKVVEIKKIREIGIEI